jgi:hypothetical protein
MPIGMPLVEQLPVLELQHRPSVQVSPALHLFIGWHTQPSEPGMQSSISTVPEAPAGITQAPDLQMPLAQSAPVVQSVFGSGTLGRHRLPSHLPLWQSLAWLQAVPAGEPELELAPPRDVDPA